MSLDRRLNGRGDQEEGSECSRSWSENNGQSARQERIVVNGGNHLTPSTLDSSDEFVLPEIEEDVLSQDDAATYSSTLSRMSAPFVQFAPSMMTLREDRDELIALEAANKPDHVACYSTINAFSDIPSPRQMPPKQIIAKRDHRQTNSHSPVMDRSSPRSITSTRLSPTRPDMNLSRRTYSPSPSNPTPYHNYHPREEEMYQNISRPYLEPTTSIGSTSSRFTTASTPARMEMYHQTAEENYGSLLSSELPPPPMYSPTSSIPPDAHANSPAQRTNSLPVVTAGTNSSPKKRDKVGKFHKVSREQKPREGQKKSKKKGFIKSLFSNQVQADFGDDALAAIQAEEQQKAQRRSSMSSQSPTPSRHGRKQAVVDSSLNSSVHSGRETESYHSDVVDTLYPDHSEEGQIEDTSSGRDPYRRSPSISSSTSSGRLSQLEPAGTNNGAPSNIKIKTKNKTRKHLQPPNHLQSQRRRFMSNHIQADFNEDEFTNYNSDGGHPEEECISNHGSVSTNRSRSSVEIDDRVKKSRGGHARPGLTSVSDDEYEEHQRPDDDIYHHHYQQASKRGGLKSLFRRKKLSSHGIIPPESAAAFEDGLNRSHHSRGENLGLYVPQTPGSYDPMRR